MNYSGILLDGYALSSTDGYTLVTPWIDLQNAEHFSMTAVITGGSVTGTFTLQQSNEQQSGNAGGVFPKSLLTSAIGTTPDTVNTPSGTGQTTLSMTTSGVPVTLNQQHIGYRWARLSYVASVKNQTGIVSIYYHWKY